MSDERLVEIETKLSHQEYLLGELEAAITKQQQKIMRLEVRCDSLLQRVRSIGEALPGDASGDDRPPHDCIHETPPAGELRWSIVAGA